MDLMAESVVTRDDEPIAAKVDGEVVMLSARAGSYFGLDAIGSEIWNMIEQPRRVADICAALVASYDVEPATCERDVIKFLDDLRGHGLVRIVDGEAQA
jgi:Coenzyme PQQ synthesis protein D (PqqD)